MRRRLLLTGGTSVLVGWILGRPTAAQPGARLLARIPFLDRDPRPVPVDAPAGHGLDARQFTDLSNLTPETLVTPAGRFFVRTRATTSLSRTQAWRIRLSGPSIVARSLTLDEVAPLIRPMGTHLLECAGNVEPFGLMSVARWHGVPVLTLLDRLNAMPSAGRLLVVGEDDSTHPWRTSIAGASWTFSRDDLVRTGAFLATAMNDAPLPSDHGGPVRLVVPGWYGCASAKWVTELEWVGDDAPATSQMLEFARRTHQDGTPRLAREFESPAIDTAAMPVRVEKWQTAGGVLYRVIGIIWGGTVPTSALEIRFNPGQSYVPVADCALPRSTSTWSLWSHDWRPEVPGTYTITLRVRDTSIRTRRLDLGYYARRVSIDAG